MKKDLENKINGLTERIGKECKVPVEVVMFNHIFNPLAFYGRLKEMGFCHECARDLANAYQELVYDFVTYELNEKYGNK